MRGDDQPGWRPERFGRSSWGCTVDFRFPVVKLLDYVERVEETRRTKSRRRRTESVAVQPIQFGLGQSTNEGAIGGIVAGGLEDRGSFLLIVEAQEAMAQDIGQRPA